MGYGNSLTDRPRLVGAFFTGVLATLVATPCTAPFMGSAIGFALSQSVEVVFGIFTVLALGLALPYLLPAVGRWLPRPGRWMETFKQLMAFLVFGTVIWLAWVLGLQTSAEGPVTLLLAFFSIGFVVWVANRWRQASVVAAIQGIVAVGIAASSLEGKTRCSEWRCSLLGNGRTRLGTLLPGHGGRIPRPRAADLHRFHRRLVCVLSGE